MTYAITGYDTKIEVRSGAESSAGWEELEEVTSITPPNESVDQIDVTHMKSPNRTREFIPGLRDPGELTLEMNYLPESDTDTLVLAWRSSGEVRDMRITYPTGTVDTFKAFPLSYTPQMGAAEAMTASLGLKVAGAITRTPAA